MKLHKTERWQLQEAKNKLSQVLQRAQEGAPQIITLRGKDAAVVLSFEEYQRLSAPSEKLSAFFQRSPLAGSALELERSQDTGRDIEL